ncbi:MAG TPA: DUF2934 domain-containing protein [Steroidobacteraceae bacterium]|nr:DUF2934 domain-containing protein [Steroidobacteraceae bacterium]
MNDRTNHAAADATRALEERTARSAGITSGAFKARAIKSRTGKRPQAREAMIAEAAYLRCAHRGFEAGHDVDDWLAAESEIDAALSRGDVPQFCG